MTGAPRAAAARPGALVVALAFVAFVSLGLPDALLGVAWPSMRRELGVSLDALGAFFVAAVTGYLAATLGAGRLVARLGVGLLLAGSCGLTALALAGVALAPAWAVVVAIGLVSGAGAGAIDAGLNAYAALAFSPRLLNWMHACFGIGMTIGPALMGAVLDAGLSWRVGYAISAGAQAALALAFLLTAGRWDAAGAAGRDRTDAAAPAPATAARAGHPHARPVWRRPTAWLGVGLFFAYTGVEVSTGGWAYTVLTEARGFEPGPASLVVSAYWGALAAGRVLFGVVANGLDPVRLVRGCLAMMVAGALLVWADLGAPATVLGLVLVGFFAAPVFPTLISATPSRQGVGGTTDAVGLQIGAAALGGALLPGLAGVLAERLSLEVVAPFSAALGATALVLHEAMLRGEGRAEGGPAAR
jgi:fucose permease